MNNCLDKLFSLLQTNVVYVPIPDDYLIDVKMEEIKKYGFDYRSDRFDIRSATHVITLPEEMDYVLATIKAFLEACQR